MFLFGRRKKENTENFVIEIKEYQPDNFDYLFQNAIEDFDDGDIKGAIAHLNRCLKINPNHSEAHTRLGICFIAQGKQDIAVKEFLEAIRLDHNNSYAHNYLASTYEKQGKLEKAISEWKAAVKIKPYYASYLDLGTAYDKKGQYGDAIKAYQSFLKLTPPKYTADIKKVEKRLNELKKKVKSK